MNTKRTNRSVAAAFLYLGVSYLTQGLAPGAVKADFNKDGWGDLAVGVPDEEVNGFIGAGAINVIYGSSAGLTALGSRFLTEGTNCPGATEIGGRFGAALTTGDFNKDGYSDLAVGAPRVHVSGLPAGVVHVFYGNSSGLSCAASELWSQNSIAGSSPEFNDQFGGSVAAGDFNKDGFDDLAIGAPDDSVPNAGNAGSVTILYGSARGLTTGGAKVWTLNSPGIPGDAAPGDGFGAFLAAGNFGNGPQTDLAIGLEYKNLGLAHQAGAVAVIYGSATGLNATGSQFLTENGIRGRGASQTDELFGSALAAGNFGKTLEDDLAIGAVGEKNNTGAVFVLYGSSTGLTSTGNQLWSGAAPWDRYGRTLAAADFAYSFHADLAIGAPGANVALMPLAGAVQVLYGSPAGLSATNSQPLNLAWKAAEGDFFGSALAAANFGNGPRFDLAVGIPGRKVGTTPKAGAVSVHYGSGTGLFATGQIWSQDSGIPDMAEFNDGFGAALPH